MAYPSTWLQVSARFPVQIAPVGADIFPCLLLQFVYSGGDFTDALLFDLRSALDSWIVAWMKPITCTNNVGDSIAYNAYVNLPTGVFFFGTASAGIFNVADSLPASQGAIVQMWTGSYSRRQRGRKFFPCIPTSFVTAGMLNATGLAAYNSIVPIMLAPIVVGPITVQMVVASFADVAAYPIISGRVMTRLGLIKRRGRQVYHSDTDIPWDIPT